MKSVDMIGSSPRQMTYGLSPLQQLEAMNALNDALCMRGLENMSTLNVPVQAPATWQRTDWLDDLNLDVRMGPNRPPLAC